MNAGVAELDVDRFAASRALLLLLLGLFVYIQTTINNSIDIPCLTMH